MNPCSQSIMKRKINPASTTDEEQTTPPTTRVRRISSSSSSSSPSAADHHGSNPHHSLELSEEFKIKRDHLFNSIMMPQPQEPHLQQLPKSISGSVRKGFRMVLDMEFVHLADKLSESPFDPIDFSQGIQEYYSQFCTLEENGYNVDKLWERFDRLRRLSIEEKRIREEKKEKEIEKKDKNVKVCFSLDKIDSLKKEIRGMEIIAKGQSQEIKSIELMVKGCDEEIEKTLMEMSETATPW